tara:strand:- start:1400 stop:1879 length:480 start_codon:yes stop_codon:yes gene_type:complete
MIVETEDDSATHQNNELRHRAREGAVQMLYQWEVGGTPIDDVVQAFRSETPKLESSRWVYLSDNSYKFAAVLARGVAGSVERLDPLIEGAADHWRLERMAIVDRLILRLAVWEFLDQPETPGRVIINEALELARTFSTDESVGFINGVLDEIRRSSERE